MNNSAKIIDSVYNTKFKCDEKTVEDDYFFENIEDLGARLDRFAKESFIGADKKLKADREIKIFELRQMARKITKRRLIKDKNNLIEERNLLVSKKFDEGLNKNEENRLAFVRWQLNRIEDAEIGDDLDKFEKMASEYEKFSKDLEKLITAITRKK